MCTEATPITLPSLPNELLVAIAAAGQEGRLPDLRTPFNLKSEWTLSHLSRRFREVIVGAPMLWKLVEANLNSLGSLEIFELYLERSGTCPIWATFQHDLLSSSAGLSAKRLSKIVPHINRVCWLRIMLRRAWADEVLAPLRYIAAPKLKHLEIIHPDLIAGSGPSTVSRWTTSLTHFEFFGYDSDDSEGNSLLVAITSSCLFLAHLYLDLTWIPTAGLRFHIPSLKFLSISIQDSEHPLYLRSIAGVFDTPSLTEFIIDGTHGDQIFDLLNWTGLPHSSFPSLTSFSFINRGSCSCEANVHFSRFACTTFSSPPPRLFPVLSSLTLINQCFTSNFVTEILGPASQPWPLLKTVALCPMQSALETVRGVLRDAMHSRHQRGQPLSNLRLSPALLSLEDWHKYGANVERFDPVDLLNSFPAP
ncbi:hypothetical protein B0H13DRAFT_2358773 [Mycena leptocephala]|nr:hypothetical protein B0H13DRAFT_2358773 [Mycena leptocephala]